jgi:hypothetical protein
MTKEKVDCRDGILIGPQGFFAKMNGAQRTVFYDISIFSKSSTHDIISFNDNKAR